MSNKILRPTWVVLTLLAAGLFAAYSAEAGQRAQNQKQTEVSLSVVIDEGGKAQVSVITTVEPPSVDQIQRAITEALGVTLNDVKLDRKPFGADYEDEYEQGI